MGSLDEDGFAGLDLLGAVGGRQDALGRGTRLLRRLPARRDGLDVALPREASGAVTLLVRPERMSVIAGADGASASPSLETDSGRTAIAGRVEDVLYHGASTRWLVRAGERLLAVEETLPRNGDGPPPSSGERVTVSWRHEDARILPPSPSSPSPPAKALSGARE